MAETGTTQREGIAQLIREVNVEHGQTLRQVQVPDAAYKIARSFLKWAPNESLGPGHVTVPLRYKVLHRISHLESVYTLLMADAGFTPITGAKGKIEEWKEATKSLLRYALNLKLAPKRQEFLRMKLSSSYYVYQVAKKLKGAEKILLCMGYEPVGSQSGEVQELKYNGDVKMELVIDTAVDLVVLHADLDLIDGIVLAAQQERYRNVILYDILNARSEANDSLNRTLARSVSLSFQRISGSKQPPVVHPTAVPSRALQPQHCLEMNSDSAAFQRSSAPSTQQDPSFRQPHRGALEQQQASLSPPNCKEDFNKVDKALEKAQGVGKDSVDPKHGNYPVILARSPSGSRSKSGSTLFDPDKLPEPAFDTHDLEMFHQEEIRSPEDSIMSGHMSMIIDARSAEYDDFSGPNLDDHLMFRSHDSGHEGLAEISHRGVTEISHSGMTGITHGGVAAITHGDVEEDDDRCVSGIHGIFDEGVPRVKEVVYEEVRLDRGKEEPMSKVSFEDGHDNSSAITKPPSSMIESSRPTPRPRPRANSGGKTLEASNLDISPKPMPRPMSHQNLLSAQIPTPPKSPQRDKPVAKPRRKKLSPSDTSPVHTPDAQAASETLPSMDNERSINTLCTLPSSNITSLYSATPSLQCDTCISDHLDPESLPHSEAHTSHESDSPHPSFEQKPSVSARSDPYPGTSHDNATSACSGDKVFTETDVTDSLGSWVQVDVETKESQSQPSSLDTHRAPIRKRSDAFSTRPEKPPEKRVYHDVAEICYDPRLVQLSHDIQNATSCWYCMNLTTDRICDICGKEQEHNKDTRV